VIRHASLHPWRYAHPAMHLAKVDSSVLFVDADAGVGAVAVDAGVDALVPEAVEPPLADPGGRRSCALTLVPSFRVYSRTCTVLPDPADLVLEPLPLDPDFCGVE
jgi:hypothetical protein